MTTVNGNLEMITCIDGSRGIDYIVGTIKKCWHDIYAFNVTNVSRCNYVKFYQELASNLGTIKKAHPVNDKTKSFEISRDIKPVKELNHYYCSDTRQPLHSDFAYYPLSKAPDWLILYCLEPSRYGGMTHLLSTRTLTRIMREFKPDLLDKLNHDVTWLYTGIDGDCEHKRPILRDEMINWNYWQIKDECNDKITIEIRNEFFDFLEKIIVEGSIYDFSKTWKEGDAIIFNDRRFLHGRDAFLGDRWLKDHAIFSDKVKKIK